MSETTATAAPAPESTSEPATQQPAAGQVIERPATPMEAPACQSPPPAPMPPAASEPDPRARLLQLAAELARSQNRRLLVEFLRLRRAV